MKRIKRLVMQVLGGGLILLGLITLINVSFPGSIVLMAAFALVAGVLILLDQ